jgi:hypothetical protein
MPKLGWLIGLIEQNTCAVSLYFLHIELGKNSSSHIYVHPQKHVLQAYVYSSFPLVDYINALLL